MLVNCPYRESGIVGKLQINWGRTVAEQEHENREDGEFRVSVSDSFTQAGSCTPLGLELGSQAQHTPITTIWPNDMFRGMQFFHSQGSSTYSAISP